MGTFAEIYGYIDIPEAQREEFREAVVTVLHRGGMVQFKNASCHGTEIHLIQPLAFDEDGWARCHYNYIDDVAWETVGYNRKTDVFYSGKLGGETFINTVISVCRLKKRSNYLN